MKIPEGYILVRKEEWLQMKQEIAALRLLVEDLRKQLNKDSTNSHKPPSTDVFRKPIQNNREKSDRK